MMYYAHKKDDGTLQPLKDHLEETAIIAEQFAAKFGCGPQGHLCALGHDIGKYSKEFVKRLLFAGPKVDHSSAGAQWAAKNCDPFWGRLFAYIIAGHHSGLADFGSSESGLVSRLHKTLPLFEDYKEELELGPIADYKDFLQCFFLDRQFKQLGFQCAFLTRMLYSCLTDADFLETESFMDEERSAQRGKQADWETLYQCFENHMQVLTAKSNDSEINQYRQEILAQCSEAAEKEAHFLTLTVPTGGGKTLASMAFAIKRAQERGADRIIYVIPYSSIIEQNAAIYRDIFGEENVLEHHMNFDFEQNLTDAYFDRETLQFLQLSSENWDIPLIVTTNVQFFESLFANRSSRCRKLHNLANSIIILDEAQMLPVYFLRPCLLALEQLALHYHAVVVFCTATKPEFPKGLLTIATEEIITEPDLLYDKLRRTKTWYIGEKSDEELALLLQEKKKCLCVVNKREHAAQLYQHLNCENGYKFLLSGRMCAKHRQEVLKKIKQSLKNENDCIVISTQLIECGVDISFPFVFRSMAGMDSVVQAGGRCNRENELQGLGDVYVFESTERYAKLQGYQALTASCGKYVLEKFADPASLDAIQCYFRMLYSLNAEVLDKERVLAEFVLNNYLAEFNFATAASKFQLIEDTCTLVVPYDRVVIEQIEYFRYSQSKKALRRMQLYGISIYPNQIEELKKRRAVEELSKNLYVLRSREGFYNEEFGLCYEEMESLIY